VGQKRPNDFGLFDMHGNVWTWCHESGSLDSGGTVKGPDLTKGNIREVSDFLNRVLRGASCLNHSSLVRAAQRNDLRPPYRSYTVGVRVARTCD
jgi:formylglycine-generating enzyme required for sulfatase activity